MKHNNRQGELQYPLSQEAEIPSYMNVCKYFVDIYISIYFQINLSFICFILPLQINSTVLQYLNRYESSLPSRRATIPTKPVGRDSLLYVRQYL